MKSQKRIRKVKEHDLSSVAGQLRKSALWHYERQRSQQLVSRINCICCQLPSRQTPSHCITLTRDATKRTMVPSVLHFTSEPAFSPPPPPLCQCFTLPLRCTSLSITALNTAVSPLTIGNRLDDSSSISPSSVLYCLHSIRTYMEEKKDAFCFVTSNQLLMGTKEKKANKVIFVCCFSLFHHVKAI